MRSLILPAALAVCSTAFAAPYTAKGLLPVATVFQPGIISTAEDESHPTFSGQYNDADVFIAKDDSVFFIRWT